MTVRALRAALALFTVLGLSGCSTILSMQFYGPRVYSGVRYDGESLLGEVTEGPIGLGYPWIVGYVLVDFPCSLAVDTLLLPLTIYHALMHGEYQPARRQPPRPSLTSVEGMIFEGASPAFEVVPAGTDPSPDALPLTDATITVFARMEGPPETLCLSWSDYRGRFIVGGSKNFRWESIRVTCEGYQPLEIPASELQSPYDKEYWKGHRLQVRLVR